MVRFSNPELEQFIEDQVKSGRFPSRDAAVEAAVERMMLEETELDEETLASIEQSEQELERGEGRDWKEVFAELRKKHLEQ